jgi:hypothetical protein
VTIKTDLTDIFNSGVVPIYGLESFTSLHIIALYLDIIHLGLSEIPVSIFEDVVADLDLDIAEKMFSSRVPVWIEEVLVLLDCLFRVPATACISDDSNLVLRLTHRKSSSPSERIR